MVTGSTHASLCAIQPIYATVTDIMHKTQCPRVHLQKIPSKLKIPWDVKN